MKRQLDFEPPNRAHNRNSRNLPRWDYFSVYTELNERDYETIQIEDSDEPGPSSSLPLLGKRKRRKLRAALLKSVTEKPPQNDDDFRLVLVHEDFPRTPMTRQQVAAVQSAAITKMKALPETEPLPQFHDSLLVHGALLVMCQSLNAKKWLKSIVNTLTPWEGAKLRLFNLDELPHLTKMSVFIPGVYQDTTEILTLLKRQNPGLDTSLWHVIERYEQSDGIALDIGVDEQSLEILADMDFQLFLGMARITFRMPG